LNFPEHFTAAYHLVLQAMVEMENYEDYETIYQRLLTTAIEQEAWEEVLSTLENYRYWHYRPQIIADFAKTPTSYAQTKEQLNTTRRLWQSTQQVRHREQIDTLLTERGQKWESFYYQSPLQALTEVQKLITYKDIQEIVASPEVGLISIYYHHHQNCLLLFLLVNNQLTNHRIDLGGSLDNFSNLTAPELTQALQLNELCAKYLSTVSQLVLVADQNLRQIPWANLPMTETDALDRVGGTTNKALEQPMAGNDLEPSSPDQNPEEEVTDSPVEPATLEPGPITIAAETAIIANNTGNAKEDERKAEAKPSGATQDLGQELATSGEETAIEEDTVLVGDQGIQQDEPSSTHEDLDYQADGVVEAAPSPIPEPGGEEVEGEEVEGEENEDQIERAVAAALQQQLQSTAESEPPAAGPSNQDLPSGVEQWVLNFDDFVAPVSPRATITNQPSTNTTNDNDIWVLTLPETNRSPVTTTAVMERWDLTWEDLDPDSDGITMELEDGALDGNPGQALEILPPEVDVPPPQTYPDQSPEETFPIVELVNDNVVNDDDPEPTSIANNEGPPQEELGDSASSTVTLGENSDGALDSLAIELEPREERIAPITEAQETAIELSSITIDSPATETPIIVSEEKTELETFTITNTITNSPDPIEQGESVITIQDQSPAKPMGTNTTLGQKYFLKVVDNILLLKCYEDMGG
ncbi:MAG: hypothetical protein HC796_04340, partial [Synechococcaceae cyanobacterium RL_1_2]|nr:hypothetical protein [Synechococcaceae cyanobacterium RL_1_2]